ncbi:MAG: hypothetical protein QM772_12100 [Ottowia sp.]|uniref:hypothetical protein n=1 Tax=Ottowia sp. TaxID=1898956 RepID=UPI0039E2C90E
MINKEGLKRRLDKNQLLSLAGASIRQADGELAKNVTERHGDNILFLMESDDGLYFSLGERGIYALTSNGEHKRYSFEDFLSMLRLNSLSRGKSGVSDFISDDKDKVWVKDPETMNSIWNTILFMQAAS